MTNEEISPGGTVSATYIIKSNAAADCYVGAALILVPPCDSMGSEWLLDGHEYSPGTVNFEKPFKIAKGVNQVELKVLIGGPTKVGEYPLKIGIYLLPEVIPFEGKIGPASGSNRRILLEDPITLTVANSSPPAPTPAPVPALNVEKKSITSLQLKPGEIATIIYTIKNSGTTQYMLAYLIPDPRKGICSEWILDGQDYSSTYAFKSQGTQEMIVHVQAPMDGTFIGDYPLTIKFDSLPECIPFRGIIGGPSGSNRIPILEDHITFEISNP